MSCAVAISDNKAFDIGPCCCCKCHRIEFTFLIIDWPRSRNSYLLTNTDDQGQKLDSLSGTTPAKRESEVSVEGDEIVSIPFRSPDQPIIRLIVVVKSLWIAEYLKLYQPQNTMTGTAGHEGDPCLNTFSGCAATVFGSKQLVDFFSALLFNSNLIASCPFAAANDSGVYPSSSFASMLAFFSSNILTTISFPLLTAHNRGVKSSLSFESIDVLISVNSIWTIIS